MANSKNFSKSFKDIYPNLTMRYNIRREVDIMNEFIQFVDNTRNKDLQSIVYEELIDFNRTILNYISHYETESKEDAVASAD